MNKTLRIISSSVITAFLLVSALAQGQSQQSAATTRKRETAAAPTGGNTPGRIAKFTGTKTVGDSNITEDVERQYRHRHNAANVAADGQRRDRDDKRTRRHQVPGRHRADDFRAGGHLA